MRYFSNLRRGKKLSMPNIFMINLSQLKFRCYQSFPHPATELHRNIIERLKPLEISGSTNIQTSAKNVPQSSKKYPQQNISPPQKKGKKTVISLRARPSHKASFHDHSRNFPLKVEVLLKGKGKGAEDFTPDHAGKSQPPARFALPVFILTNISARVNVRTVAMAMATAANSSAVGNRRDCYDRAKKPPTIRQRKSGRWTDGTKPHPHFSVHNMASIHYSEQRCTFPVLGTSRQYLPGGIHNLGFRTQRPHLQLG